jgi:hypothetical protein
MEMILISNEFSTKTEASIWANRQTQLRRHGAKIKIVTCKYDNGTKLYFVARSVVPTDKTRMLSDSKKMGKGTIKNTISIYDYAKRSLNIVEPNSKNEIKPRGDR